MKYETKVTIAGILLTLFLLVAKLSSAYEYYIPYYDMRGDTYTGIALTNMSAVTAHVTLHYY